MENLQKLNWLSGYWEIRQNEYVVTEQWMLPEGNSMFAVNRTIKSGKTITYEYMRIQLEVDGRVFLYILPAGQEEVAFKLISEANGVAIFENSLHDFPQRVTYSIDDEDKLFCRAERLNSKPEEGISIRFNSVKLPNIHD